MTTVEPNPKVDPSGRAMFAGLSGLELLRRVQTAEHPAPGIATLLGMRLVTVEEGRVVFEVDAKPEFSNPLGTVHGGIHATLLDSALGCAIHSALPAGVGYTTLELKVNYIRAVGLDSGTLTCVGTTIHVGGKTATAEGRVTDAQDRLIAHATTTCLLFR
jgi:uncharacterized protein (TIGR00369 family)